MKTQSFHKEQQDRRTLKGDLGTFADWLDSKLDRVDGKLKKSLALVAIVAGGIAVGGQIDPAPSFSQNSEKITVQPGDNFSSLTARLGKACVGNFDPLGIGLDSYRTTVMNRSNLWDPDLVQPGQTLYVPTSCEVSPLAIIDRLTSSK